MGAALAAVIGLALTAIAAMPLEAQAVQSAPNPWQQVAVGLHGTPYGYMWSGSLSATPSGVTGLLGSTAATVFSPDGTKAYFAGNVSQRAVYEVDVVTSTVLHTFALGVDGPWLGSETMALTADGSTLFVAGYSGDVAKIDIATGAVANATISSNSLRGIAIDSTGSRVYVAAYGDNCLYVLNGSTLATESIVSAAPFVDQFALQLSADGSMLYVSYGVASANQPAVSMYDTASFDRIDLPRPDGFGAGDGLCDLALSPDGSTLYGIDRMGTIYELTLATGTWASYPNPKVLPSRTYPAIAITADGGTLYQIDAEYYLFSFDTTTHENVLNVNWRDSSSALAVAPDQAPVAAIVAQSGTIGTPVTFDASGSTASVCPISTYDWDFGDGSTEQSSTSTTTHSYATPDSYTVSVTATTTCGTSTGTPLFNGQMVLRNSGPSARATTAVRISPPASTVTIDPIADRSDVLGAPVSLQAMATDSAGATVTYSADGLPPGLSIDPASGFLTGTPTALGAFAATVTAANPTGAHASTSFTWTIVEPAPTPPPTAPSVPGSVGGDSVAAPLAGTGMNGVTPTVGLAVAALLVGMAALRRRRA